MKNERGVIPEGGIWGTMPPIPPFSSPAAHSTFFIPNYNPSVLSRPAPAQDFHQIVKSVTITEMNLEDAPRSIFNRAALD